MRNKVSRIADKCSLVAINEDGITMTRGGNYAIVIEFSGKDYSGLDDETTNSFFETRKMFFEKLNPQVTISHHTHRFLTNSQHSIKNYSISIAKKVAQRWNNNFTTNYRTRHFFVLSTAYDALDNLQNLFVKDSEKKKNESLKIKLEEIKNDIMIRFKSYNPILLKGDALFSYWATLANGRQVYQKAFENMLLDDLLFGTDIYFPKSKKYQEYQGATKKKYSGWLVIKMPANLSGPDLLASLMQLKYNFSIYQTFSAFSKDASLRYLDDKMRNASIFLKSAEIIQLEIAEAAQKVQSDQINLIRHRWSLEIFANTIEDLKQAMSEISNQIEFSGYRVDYEKINVEALFWSRFPGMESLNPRQRNITSENAADWSSMDAVGQGLNRCSWGDYISSFKTGAGGVYSFTFHATLDKMALGNTIVIGGTGTGKTTLISFLISQCFKYQNFRALLFDRLRGLEIFTRFHNGIYLDFLEGIEVNPLQLQDSGVTRTFLSQFFQMLLPSFTSQNDIKIIDDAVRQIMTLQKTERNINNIADAFGLGGEDTIRNALNKWLTEGSNGAYFAGKKDALEFSALTTFDMTYLLESPDILGPMTYYIFHRLLQAARTDGGYIVFLDEMANYLKSSVFTPKVEMLLQEIRKTDGVLVGAVQDAGTILDHEIAPKILNNTETYILFSEPRAQEKHYIEGLGLNEREFIWLKEDHPRHILVKRKSGESVILNVDLSSLNGYLKIFNSDASEVKRLNDFRKAGGDWKNEFLEN